MSGTSEPASTIVTEVRCDHCSKCLAKSDGIKCSRCGTRCPGSKIVAVVRDERTWLDRAYALMSTAKTAGKVDPKVIACALLHLATSECDKHAAERTWYKGLKNNPYMGDEFPQLVEAARGFRYVANTKDLLATFMEAEAAEFLVSLPNLYWLWRVLSQSLLTVVQNDNPLPIYAAHLKTTAASYSCKRFPEAACLHNQSERPEDVAFMVAAGFYTINVQNFAASLVPNPVFMLPSSDSSPCLRQ